ncbi:hypothetical protein ACH5RR_008372 [Cinchona calisaya]|uniref:Uncharacterized protein n=1 Tax=Cinchona calisaya TaxID=153742 RepID=A0ABD3AF12_9GENT
MESEEPQSDWKMAVTTITRYFSEILILIPVMHRMLTTEGHGHEVLEVAVACRLDKKASSVIGDAHLGGEEFGY